MALIMCVTPVLFAGCDDLGLEGSTGGLEGGITGAVDSAFASFFDGFKVVYSDSQTGQQKNITKLSDALSDGLLVNLTQKYGSGKNQITFFPDAIRQTIINEGGVATLKQGPDVYPWNWTLDPNDKDLSVNKISELLNNEWDDFKSLALGYREDYPGLSEYYSIPIQIVLYEVMLGFEELTKLEARYIPAPEIPNEKVTIVNEVFPAARDVFEIIITSSPNKQLIDKIVYKHQNAFYINLSNEKKLYELPNGNETFIDDLITNYLDSLKQQYYSTATYHGLTKADADRLIDYILNEVIGADVVKYDLEKFAGNKDNFRNYVYTVAELIYKAVYDGSSEYVYTYKNENGETIRTYPYQPVSAEKGDAAARPASYLRDYESEMFFESSNSLAGVEGATAFENSPLSEYQSVVIMPAKDIGLSGIIFQIFTPKANFNMEMTISVRYWAYDKESGEGRLFTWSIEPLDFYHQYPHSPACTGKSCDEQEYVEGKGYLYYANEEIEGYWTDFTVPLETDAVDEDLIIVPEGPNKLKRIELPKFENSDGLKPTGEGVTSTNGITEVDLGKGDYYYKVIPSQTGYGGVTVLDEKRIEFSFFEVVFDIKKDPTNANANYDFKLAVLTPY